MSPFTVLGVRIAIPAEAVVPLLIAAGILLVLVFAGSSLQVWKAKHPKGARIGGAVLAIAFTGVALYFLAPVLRETSQRDPIHTGLVLVGFVEGPIAGGFAALAAMLWSFANQRWIGLVTGLGIGVALILKPLVWPLMHQSYNGGMRQWDLIDPEHLSFLGPGIVAVIVGLVVGLRPRQ